MKLLNTALVILCLLNLMGCSSKTVEEAFRKKYSEKHYEILYTNKVKDTTFAIYKAPFKGGNTGIGLALFAGDNKKGWTMLDSVSKFTDSDVIIDSILLKGDELSGEYILYGSLDNRLINRIEVIDKYGARKEGVIINTSWNKVWYCAAEINELKINFYDKDGNLVYKVPLQ